MKRTMILLIALAALVGLPGCAGVSQEDGTAHVEGLNGMAEEFLGLHDAFKAVTDRSVGDANHRALILEKLSGAKRNFMTIYEASVRAIRAQMDVDVDRAYGRAEQLYMQWLQSRGENGRSP